MVADNNQEPASNKETVSTAKPDGNSQSSAARGLHRIGRKKFLIALLTAVLIAIWAIFGLHVGQKVYAQAAGHKIYKHDVENLIGGTKGVSDRQAATVLADKYLTEAMAKEQKVAVTDKDIETQYGPGIKKQKNQDRYAYQLQVNQLYLQKLQAKNQGIYKGKLLMTNFSRHVPYHSPLLAEEKGADPKLGDPAAIAQDKKYAQNLITNLSNQIKDGKITFDQAIQTEHDDPTVGLTAYPTLTHSHSFDTTTQPLGVISLKSIQQSVSKMKPGQMTKPIVVKVSNSVSNDSMAESYFVVVRLDSASGGNNNISFEQELAQAKKELGYKVYV